MTGDSFFAKPYAAIQLHSLGISFPRWKRDDLNGPYVRHSLDGKSLDYKKVNWSSVDEEDRKILLTDLHENDHFAMLISTPTGVLLWRLHQVLARDVLYLSKVFADAGIPLDASRLCAAKGIVAWYRASGRQQLKLVSHKLADRRVIEYLDGEVITGMDAVVRLIDILLCECPYEKYADWTSGQFAELLNIVFSYLARRSDVELAGFNWGALWVSESPDKRLFENANCLNVLLAMEILAYCRERRSAREMGATERELEQWLERVPDPYVPMLQDWLNAAAKSEHLSQVGNPETILRDVLVESLMGRIDSTTIGPCPGWDPNGCGHPQLDEIYFELKQGASRTSDGREVLFVEREWPWWRSQRVRDRFDMYCPLTIRQILTLGAIAGREKLYGPESNWSSAGEGALGTVVATALKTSFDPYGFHLRRTNDVLLAGIRSRWEYLKRVLEGHLPNLQHNDLTKYILLIEYADELGYAREDFNEFFPILSSVFFGVITTITHSLAMGFVPKDPEPLIRKLCNFFRRAAEVYPKLKEQAEEAEQALLVLFSKQALERMLQMKIW